MLTEEQVRERERAAFNQGALHEYEALLKRQEKELGINIEHAKKHGELVAATVPFTESYGQRYERRHSAAVAKFPSPVRQRVVTGEHGLEYRVEHGRLEVRNAKPTPGYTARWMPASWVYSEDIKVVCELLNNPTEPDAG